MSETQRSLQQRVTAPVWRLEKTLAGIPTLPLAWVLALALALVGFRWNTWTAGGADSFGYLAEADMFLSGRLTMNQPWVRDVPWPMAASTFSPLGFRPRRVVRAGEIAEDPLRLVPVYSPGFPLLVAAAKSIGGHVSGLAVVPAMGGLLVLATYGLGRRLGTPRAGLLAAWFVATSPVTLYMVVQPMSDVPAAAAWAIAFWCLLGRSAGWALAAGAASGLAVLIRPNLVPMAGIVGLWLIANLWRPPAGDARRGLLRVLMYGAGLVPGIAAVAFLNNLWHGSPLRSGYPPLSELFAWSNVPIAAPRFLRAFVETQTPMALAGMLALVVPILWRQGLAGRPWPLALLAAAVVCVWAEYSAYVSFPEWWYLRFLLPSWPMLMLGVAMALTWPARNGRPGFALVAMALGVSVGGYGLWTAEHRFAFSLQRAEARYAAVAQLARDITPQGTVIFSMQHSGSLRYYGDRITLRWDYLDPEWLDRAVTWLSDRGAHPYAVLEQWEVVQFRERFGDASATGRLGMNPVVDYDGGSRVFFFDLLRAPSALESIEHLRDTRAKIRYVLPGVMPRLVLKP